MTDDDMTRLVAGCRTVAKAIGKVADALTEQDRRVGTLPAAGRRLRFTASVFVHRRSQWLFLIASLLICLPAAAQEHFTAAPGTLSFEGRELIVLASRDTGAAVESAGPGGFVARSFETAAYRIHEVTMDGRTFRAATPLSGPRSRLVFDPLRRRFESLLPSIRVELGNGVDLDDLSSAVSAIGITVFESLEFAIVHLPADLHPAAAIERLRYLPGQPDATVRLRLPKIEWR